MKKLLNLLPHLSIAFSLTLITVLIFNGHNPRMGFLQGTPFLILALCACSVSVLTAILAIVYSSK